MSTAAEAQTYQHSGPPYGNPARGCFYAIPISLAMWAVIIGTIALIAGAIK